MKMLPYPKIQSTHKRTDKPIGDLPPGLLLDGRAGLPVEWSTESIEFLAPAVWEWTEKVDGTNIRLGFEHGATPEQAVSYIGGKTDRAQIPPKLLVALSELWQSILPQMEHTFESANEVVLFGEGYGVDAHQGGGRYRPDPGFVLFDVHVKNPNGGEFWLKREAVTAIAESLGIDCVPVVYSGPIDEVINRLLGRNGCKPIESRWPGMERPEGVVGRPAKMLYDNHGNPITTKIKVKDYPHG